MTRICKGIEPILEVIKNSEEYIRIVSFQFSDSKIIENLKKKVKEGIDVEVITLPVDSINSDEKREEMRNSYKSLREEGVKVYENMWEVGDPTLTDTSESGEVSEGGGEKWYSLHGKFLVTDRNALIMSANLNSQKEIEIFLKYEDEETINKFNDKFDQLFKDFIKKDGNIPGQLIQKLPSKQRKNLKKGFEESSRLLVKGYADSISPEEVTLERNLVITPFDIRARNILYKIIDESEDYVFLLSERLYDNALVDKLRKKILSSNLKIKIITGRPEAVRQNTTKARKFFRELASAGVSIRAIDDIHAKAWISDRYLAIGSTNLGKMNLGFRKKGQWRANTETMMIETDQAEIEEAKSKFKVLWEEAKKVETV
ncbi:hypothetical protein AKJ38_03350, partial [candidate division MSBL1 archaeon SCGC-AAA259I14]